MSAPPTPTHSLLRLLAGAGTAALVLGSAILAVWLLGASTAQVEGLTLRVWLSPAPAGSTVLELPPLGSLEADTHHAPFSLHVRLERIQPDAFATALQALAGGQGAKVADLVAWAGAWGRGFATRQAALAAIGAMLAALLVGRARPRTVVAAGFLSALLVLGVIGYGAATFRLQAFEQPRYEGVLAAAPDAIRAASRVLAHLDQLQDNAKVLVSTINGLFLRGNDLPILGINGNNGSTTRLLFISDLHSNPVGMEFVAAIVRQFKVDAVVDTGDLTDLGSPLEASLLDRLGALGVPYWLAGGNHDTPEVLAFIEDLPNGHLLRWAVADIEGVTVYGSADPLAVSPDVAPPDRETPDPQLAAQAESVQRALEADRLHPDVLVVHNPKAASRLVGTAPLVVTGHTHRQSLTRQGAGYLLNPGSAGAAGLQGLYAGGNVPYAAAVLLVDRQTGKMAVDLIRAQPDTGRFSFERRQLEEVLAGQGGQGGDTRVAVP